MPSKTRITLQLGGHRHVGPEAVRSLREHFDAYVGIGHGAAKLAKMTTWEKCQFWFEKLPAGKPAGARALMIVREPKRNPRKNSRYVQFAEVAGLRQKIYTQEERAMYDRIEHQEQRARRARESRELARMRLAQARVNVQARARTVAPPFRQPSADNTPAGWSQISPVETRVTTSWRMSDVDGTPEDNA